jgi:hypothetical protein
MAIGASAVVATSLLVLPAPAQAYGTLTVKYAVVDTDNCERIRGNLPVVAQSGGCFLDDSADNTFFVKDPGGVALKIELHDGSGMVAKQEFHPYGEHLFVYDTRNDGDTVYCMLWINGFPDNPWPENRFSPPGTNAVIDYNDFNLSYDEGTDVEIWAVDTFTDNNPTDIVFKLGGGEA